MSEQMRPFDRVQVEPFIRDGFIRIDHAVPRLLEPAGDAGLSYLELAEKLDATPDRPVAVATGEAGTVYLCHPFLVHAAQPHYGAEPRFMAQPPLDPAEPLRVHRDGGGYSPVEIAIRVGLGFEPLTRNLPHSDVHTDCK